MQLDDTFRYKAHLLKHSKDCTNAFTEFSLFYDKVEDNLKSMREMKYPEFCILSSYASQMVSFFIFL